MNDLIRKEFEEACKSQFNWSLQDPFRDKGEATLSSWDGEKYGNRIVQGMWWAWQTSRENIIIELPEIIPKDNQGDYWTGAANGFNQCINSCAISIKQAGLKVKP